MPVGRMPTGLFYAASWAVPKPDLFPALAWAMPKMQPKTARVGCAQLACCGNTNGLGDETSLVLEHEKEREREG